MASLDGSRGKGKEPSFRLVGSYSREEVEHRQAEPSRGSTEAAATRGHEINMVFSRNGKRSGKQSEPQLTLTISGIEEIGKKLRDRLPTRYTWLTKSLWVLAGECVKAVNQAQKEGNKNQGKILAEAIVDLYNKDRANRAASLVTAETEPTRRRGIPSYMTQGSFPLEIMVLRMSELTNWSTAIPFRALDVLARVSQVAVPDELWLATYEPKQQRMPVNQGQQRLPRRQWSCGDPVLYARYGEWYVKVAEWE